MIEENSEWKVPADIHTMPNDGLHIESSKCFCGPMVNYVCPETGVMQWLHNDTRKEALN